MKKIKLLIFGILFLAIGSMSAQVTGVDYQLKYDTVNCQYDALVIINEGSATSITERIQFNSQFSIIAPTGTTLTITESHNPLQDNELYTGTLPLPWINTTTVINPAALPGYDFFSVTPSFGSNTYHYNNLAAGDTVKLFSLTTSPITMCGDEIRMYENDEDPTSDDDGMGNADFKNGFTLGGTDQLYNENATTLYPPAPTVVSIVNDCSDGIEIDLTAVTSACQDTLMYSWEGPAGFTSTLEDVNISPAVPENSGLYRCTITDAFGCTTIVEIEATSKPDAGPDETICATESIILSGTNPTFGTWSINGSTSAINLQPLSGGQVQVNSENFATGDFELVYQIPGCSDTMTLTIDPQPLTIMQGAGNICAYDSIRFIANTTGTWSANNASVATIDSVTGWAYGVSQGTATFTFTADGTSCTAITATLTVGAPPTVGFQGTDTICVGSSTVVIPGTGGTWASSNDAIATVTDAGDVDGISPGTAELRFTDNNGCISDTLFVTVIPVPVITFADNDSLCVGSTIQLLPATGGSWQTTNGVVASISNTGVVTGLAPGTVTFIYTDLASGCISAESPTVTVVDGPTVAITGDPETCIGLTTNVSPTSGGTWVSSNDGIATVTNEGVVTGVSSGQVTLTFTDDITGCSADTEPIVIDAGPTVSTEFDEICIGNSTNLTPSSGGTWEAVNVAIATVSGAVVTGVTAGEAAFIFTSDATGCRSDTLFVTVTPGTDVSGNAPTAICIGQTTTLLPNTGGSWSSVDPNIATVTNDGIVTGVGAGATTFIFTEAATLCQSLETPPVTVNASPIITVDYSSLCIGETVTATSSIAFGPVWSSSNASVITIDANTGLIEAVGDGNATITVADPFTGCSTTSGILIVNVVPEVEFTGPDQICEDATTNVSPTSGGTWTSGDETIAVVSNAGLVTGTGGGTTTLTFTDTNTGCISETLTVTIIAATPVTDPLDPELCIGETTTVTPTTGGTWTSSNESVAEITNAGVITAVGQGSASFTFTSDNGSAQCSSNSTNILLVNPDPTIILDATSICVDETTTASSTNAGTWSSDDTGVATIDAVTGEITGIAPGTTTFTFVDGTTGCTSPESVIFTVSEAPEVFGGDVQICVGEETNVFPSTGGTWTSSDESIATITNAGLVTATGPGFAVFYYTQLGGCTSSPTDSVEVTPGPGTDIGPDNSLCIDDVINILPATGGTWESSDDAVASIEDDGTVTAVGAGVAVFTFTSDVTGCKSVPSDPVTVNEPITTVLTGENIICIGGFSQFTPSSGGTWTSSDDDIATIDSTGLVTGIGVGVATFVFTPDNTGCPSDETEPVSVSPSPTAEITGLDEICIGANTTLSPTTGGTWTSSDPSIATVADNGVVTALAPGVVTFTFNETASGCNSADATPPVTIGDCIVPDFNATFVDVPVDGDVSTNDGTPVGTTYGPTPVYTGGPAGAVYTITVNSDGTYTFVTDMVGVYTWDVPACIPPLVSGCQTAELVITVVDFLEPDLRPVANLDVAYTAIDTDVDIESLVNDKCVVVGGCSLDPASVTIVNNPSYGTVTVDGATGNTTYSPNAGYVGQDTLRYQVCVDGEPGNCAQANQIITILDDSGLNTTLAADDFNSGGQDTPITGDVSTNDTDPEGDTQTVVAQVTTNAAGELTLNTDGTYTFIPNETFYGPVDFPYETCDDNAIQACANATLHILVVRDIYVQVRVFLEGAFINNGNEIGITHTRPLMRDDLRKNGFNGARYIPDTEPYESMVVKEHWETYDNPSDFEDFHKFQYDYSSVETKFKTVPEPSVIFADNGEDAVVDWVSVELRDKNDYTNIITSRSGLVQRDGDVMDLNGELGLRFKGLVVDDYYIVVKHRTHLGAMTADAKTPREYGELIDFTVDETGFFDFGSTKFPYVGPGDEGYDYTGLSQSTLSGSPSSNKSGYRALWAGDADGNGRIKFTNPEDDLNIIQADVLFYPTNNFYSNFDFAFGYLPGDFDMNSKAKFDNPNDDKNYLFGQLLFYPLNTQFRSNFDFFVEQVPEAFTPK